MEKAHIHEIRTVLENDYRKSWALFTDEPIDEAKLTTVVDNDVVKIKACLVDGLDIGGIMKRQVPVTLRKNTANGPSFVWSAHGQDHWYPILQFKRLWNN